MPVVLDYSGVPQILLRVIEKNEPVCKTAPPTALRKWGRLKKRSENLLETMCVRNVAKLLTDSV